MNPFEAQVQHADLRLFSFIQVYSTVDGCPSSQFNSDWVKFLPKHESLNHKRGSQQHECLLPVSESLQETAEASQCWLS